MSDIDPKQFPEPQTDAHKRLGNQAVTSGESLYAEGQARELQPEGYDRFYVTDEERKLYKIPDHQEPCWIRNPGIWESDEKANRQNDFLRSGRGTRAIAKYEGKPVTNGDLMLAMRPKSELEAEARQRDEETKEYLYDVKEGDFDLEVARRRKAHGPTDLAQLAEQAHERHIAEGLIGQTSGMNWQDVYRSKGVEARLAEEAHFRTAGRHKSGVDRSEVEAATLERAQAAAPKNGKAFRMEGWGKAGTMGNQSRRK